MNAMILAAGRGERLRPYTDDCPKPLLTVQGQALIVRHIKALAKAGIKNIVINTSWLAKKIHHALGDGHQFSVEIHYSDEPEALETAGGIRQALDLLSDQFIVVNGDVLTRYPFEKLLSIESEAHVVLVDNPSHNQQGDFSIADKNLLSNQPHQTFSGISVYKKSFFQSLPAGRQALAPLLRSAADKGLVTAEYFDGVWSDVGTVERWQQAEELDLS